MPIDHFLGFTGSDFIELALVLFFVLLFWRPWMEELAAKLAPRTALCMMIFAAAPVLLRLALLSRHPAPVPDIYDEFGHLFVADTLRHLRLANPPHPFSRFFETFFVLQEPTYSSIYPLGQGIALAIGWVILGHPWAGVLLSSAALCPLCYWMLRGWTSPGWALAGGFLAIFEFGPLSSWMNSYWGGAFAAVGGCLVLGALPRLRASSRRLYPALLGVGFTMNLLTRPYESIFLVIAIVGYLIWWRPKLRLLQVIAMAGLAIVPAIGIMLLQNKRVTGYWSEMPYVLSQYQYGVPAALTFERDPVPHRPLTAQQEMEYKSQRAFRGGQKETLRAFLLRLEYRVRYYRFFFLAPLYLAAPLFLLALRQAKYVWVAGTLLLFAIGTNFFPAFQVHYVAAVTCLFILLSVVGLEKLGTITREAPRFLLALCAAHFIFWYTLHLFEGRSFAAEILPYETWDGLHRPSSERRRVVARELAKIPGKLLVFVSYWPNHVFQDEWVYNSADIDGSRIVWARDLGAQEDEKLRAYYPDRTALRLEPDATPPRLVLLKSGE
jgi:hypothetical protein